MRLSPSPASTPSAALRAPAGAKATRPFGCAQGARAIAAEPAAGKIRHDFSLSEVLKKQRLAETLCLTGVGEWVGCKFFHTSL